MSDAGAPPGIDPSVLDRLRRGFPLRMDRDGRFWFEGDALDHPRLVAYFRDHIDALEGGAPIIRVDGKYVHFTCDDLPYRVLHVTAVADGHPCVHLDDDRALPLDPARVFHEPEGGLWTLVPTRGCGPTLPARLSNTAAVELAAWMDDHDPPGLVVRDARFPIRAAAPPDLRTPDLHTPD